MRDIIFVSMENWDEVWRRNQFICAELSRRHPDMRILFVGLARDVSNCVRRGELSLLKATSGCAPIPEFPRITLLRPLKLLPNSVRIMRQFNEAFIRVQIRDAAKRNALTGFLGWMLGPGQPQAAALGYLALPKGVVAREQEAISRIH